MLEGLATQRARRERALNLELAVQGLGLYGLATLMGQVHVPEVVAAATTLVLASASLYRWLERRWEINDIAIGD
ncbi:MAG TPA: hypothetical protein VFL93_12100 [Longimicrobiaceae bacterium]|nr:hypothetical protein [Longimicrobiaceae bacterium]